MEWRSIEGLSRYEVSDTGLVRLAVNVMMPPGGVSGVQGVRFKKGKLLSPLNKKDGRLGYFLRTDSGRNINILMHRLVGLAFVPNPSGKKFVCHKDGDRRNNSAQNLYWGTPKESALDMWKHGTILKGERAPANVLSVGQVLQIRERLKAGYTPKEIAPDFGVGATTICAIKTGQNWAWLKDEGAEAPSDYAARSTSGV